MESSSRVSAAINHKNNMQEDKTIKNEYKNMEFQNKKKTSASAKVQYTRYTDMQNAISNFGRHISHQRAAKAMASMHRAAQTRQSCPHISIQSMDVDPT